MGWVTRRESPASQLEIGPGSEGLRFIRPLGWTLRQCGPPDHIVQLYQDQQFLNRAVCRFAASALANGEGVILVPTAAHWEAFKPRLEAEGVDIDRAKDAGQLTVVDADELLPQFMRDAMPDEAGGSRRVGESSRRRRRRTQRLIGCQVNIMLSTDVISEWGLAHSADASSAQPEWDYAEKNRPAVSRCRSRKRLGAMQIAASDRGSLRGLTQFPRLASLASVEPAEFKQDLRKRTARYDVCDNLFETVCNLLILKRRDAGAVDQARLEIDSGRAC